MGTVRNILLITSIVKKFKLHNVQCFYNSIYRIHTNNKKMTTVDAIDDFTIQLVNKISNKQAVIKQKQTSEDDTEILNYNSPWKIDFKSKYKKVSECSKLKIDISNLSIQQIESIILSALDSEVFDDVDHLVFQCVNNMEQLSVEVLLELLSAYSYQGNIKMIRNLQKMYKIIHPDLTLANSDFNHYLAKAYWMTGNIEKAQEIFIDVYANNADLRQQVTNMFTYLIRESLSTRSPASVVILNKGSMSFVENWNDWSPMLCFWESCWLSEWFGDQQLAEKLFKESELLRQNLLKSLLPMSISALRNHQEDAILRLLPMILAFNLKIYYSLVIGLLFDYRHKQRDFRGCVEIMQNCIALKIKLKPVHDEKFLNMLIANGLRAPPTVIKKINDSKKVIPFKF